MNLPPENVYGHTKKLRYIKRRLAEIARDTPDMKVLDFGCGNGSAVSQFLLADLPPSASYVGVDIHPPSVDHANSHYGRSNARFTDVLPEGQFDVIVYADVLEHLDEPLEILRSHYPLLKPGGIIVGSIPNGVGPFELESALDRRFKISTRIAGLMNKVRGKRDAIPYNIDSGHLQFYRKRKFLKMLSAAGFETTHFQNGAFFGAMVTERLLRFGGQPFMRANTAIANVLPYWVVSTWLFTARKRI